LPHRASTARTLCIQSGFKELQPSISIPDSNTAEETKRAMLFFLRELFGNYRCTSLTRLTQSHLHLRGFEKYGYILGGHMPSKINRQAF
jgi:hypothetical protein